MKTQRIYRDRYEDTENIETDMKTQRIWRDSYEDTENMKRQI